MALPTQSKRGPLRRVPVSVVLPDGPEIVQREVAPARVLSAFRVPQLKVLAGGV